MASITVDDSIIKIFAKAQGNLKVDFFSSIFTLDGSVRCIQTFAVDQLFKVGSVVPRSNDPEADFKRMLLSSLSSDVRS